MNSIQPVRPLARATLSEQVAEQIADLIAAGHWKPRDKLPSEAELCRAFHISRPSIREALKSLSFAGLVNMRSGQGSYVAEGPSRLLQRLCAHGLLTSRESVQDLTTTRLVLEGELAGLCAQRATGEELEEIGKLVVSIREAESREVFLDLDLKFHNAIATYSRNQILSQLLRAIRGLLQELIRKSADLPGDKALTCSQHEKILEALKKRDPRKARSAMRVHLRTFQRGYDLLTKISPKGGTLEPPPAKLDSSGVSHPRLT
jgi:GntR family transcriptional repressor for pyruvate dehydrogenase complex